MKHVFRVGDHVQTRPNKQQLLPHLIGIIVAKSPRRDWSDVQYKTRNGDRIVSVNEEYLKQRRRKGEE